MEGYKRWEQNVLNYTEALHPLKSSSLMCYLNNTKKHLHAT